MDRISNHVKILSGLFKPEDPKITDEARALWLRSYLEEKWRLMGRDPDNIPDVAMEKLEVEMQIYGIVILMTKSFLKLHRYDRL